MRDHVAINPVNVVYAPTVLYYCILSPFSVGIGFTRSCNYGIGNCNYRFFLSFENTMLSLSFTRLSCTNEALPWIITGSLVGAIVLLGLLFLFILKLLLLAWVSCQGCSSFPISSIRSRGFYFLTSSAPINTVINDPGL